MAEVSHSTGARSPEFALLGFLYQQSSHGYTLHQQLVTELGYLWHVSQSQTYNILKRLETHGYIVSSIQEQEQLPPRHVLKITAAGRRRFADWLRTPTGGRLRTIRLEFITRLYFAQRLFPKWTVRLIEDEAEDIRATLARLEADLEHIVPEQTFNRLSLELRIQQLRSVREWMIACRTVFEART